MASFWNRLKGDSAKSSVVSAPKQPLGGEPAPRFTSAQMDQMRGIVDALNRDILLYREAEGIGNHVRILWGLFTRKQLAGSDERAVVADIEELATAFHSSMGPIDDHLSYIENERSRLSPRHGPAVETALTEFKRTCDEARTKMDQLQQACNRLQLNDAEESERARDCRDRLQDLKGAVNNMHASAPGIWRPLYNDIRDLVVELKGLLPE